MPAPNTRIAIATKTFGPRVGKEFNAVAAETARLRG
jgi:hypothetical protein